MTTGERCPASRAAVQHARDEERCDAPGFASADGPSLIGCVSAGTGCTGGFARVLVRVNAHGMGRCGGSGLTPLERAVTAHVWACSDQPCVPLGCRLAREPRDCGEWSGSRGRIGPMTRTLCDAHAVCCACCALGPVRCAVHVFGGIRRCGRRGRAATAADGTAGARPNLATSACCRTDA